jgi:hypothetical protein
MKVSADTLSGITRDTASKLLGKPGYELLAVEKIEDGVGRYIEVDRLPLALGRTAVRLSTRIEASEGTVLAEGQSNQAIELSYEAGMLQTVRAVSIGHMTARGLYNRVWNAIVPARRRQEQKCFRKTATKLIGAAVKYSS